MRKILSVIGSLCMSGLLFTNLAYAEDWPPYISKDELPDAVKYLPPPPNVSSEAFKADVYYYNWGKENRKTPRGELAKKDAVISTAHIAEVFSEPMGIEISKAKTPKLYELIGRAGDTAMSATKSAKKHHGRTRPYVQFKEASLCPEDEPSQNPNASYPSGHSTMGWSVALILVEINPEAQDAILKRGYEFGESRVIVGAHYESDVNMARLVASAAVARIHADPEFMRDLAAARDEFISVKTGQTQKVNTGQTQKVKTSQPPKRPQDNIIKTSNKQKQRKVDPGESIGMTN